MHNTNKQGKTKNRITYYLPESATRSEESNYSTRQNQEKSRIEQNMTEHPTRTVHREGSRSRRGELCREGSEKG